MTAHRLTVSKSTVVRDMINMCHQHHILDHSFIARSDPRFNDQILSNFDATETTR